MRHDADVFCRKLNPSGNTECQRAMSVFANIPLCPPAKVVSISKLCHCLWELYFKKAFPHNLFSAVQTNSFLFGLVSLGGW